MQSQRAFNKIQRDWVENNHAKTAEVKSNNPKLKQKLPQKESSRLSKVSRKRPQSSQFPVTAAWFQKLTTMCLVKIYDSGNKKSSPKAVFSQKNLSENSTIGFLPQPRGHMNTHQMLRVVGRPTLEAISQALRVVVNHGNEQK